MNDIWVKNNMRVYVCGEQFDTIMTGIYDAWSWALKNGHENVRLIKHMPNQPSLFDEYITVDVDMEKSAKVTRSVEREISQYAYMQMYYACLSYEEDALDAIYKYLILGFKNGETVSRMLHHPVVMRMMEIQRKVSNEAHSFREFVRFSLGYGEKGEPIYISHIEPKSNVIYLLGNFFQDRMPSEYWCIVDDTRSLAVFHPKDQDYYFQYLTDEEMLRLYKLEEERDEFIDLWKEFFKTIAIKERENYRCQRNLMPLWMRKHAVEFME